MCVCVCVCVCRYIYIYIYIIIYIYIYIYLFIYIYIYIMLNSILILCPASTVFAQAKMIIYCSALAGNDVACYDYRRGNKVEL